MPIFDSRWDDAHAASLDPVDLLAYRSNLLGADERIVNRGGGNTSTKHTAVDYRGRELPALAIKASGYDLKTAPRAAFPDVALEAIAQLRRRDAMSDEDMVGYLAHALLEPNAPRPSIETLLHGFLPWRDVDHVHADAIVSFCMAERGEALTRSVFGDEVVWVPYIRPGFSMAKWCADAVEAQPNCRAVFLGKHGLVTWADNAKQSYLNSLEFINRAAEYIEQQARGRGVFGGLNRPTPPLEERRTAALQLLPALRGRLSRRQRVILHHTQTDDVLEFVNSRDAAELAARGLACPDHVLYTKVKPVFLEASGVRRPASGAEAQAGVVNRGRALDEALAAYAGEYGRFFQDQSAGDPNPPQPFEAFPKVVLAPDVGMVTAGKDQRAAMLAAENYARAIQIMRGASLLDSFGSLTDREAYDFEYWPLELYKLTLLPPEKELARRVALVTGAAGAIGRAIARRFAQEGAHLALADLDLAGVEALARELPGPAVAMRCDVTDEASVQAALEETVLAFGGLDVVVSNAGVAVAQPLDELSLEDWRRTQDVLLTGYFLVTREALRVMKRQVLAEDRPETIGGSIVFVASKAGLAPAKNAAAYTSAKAGELHLARCAAEEAGPFGIRVNSLAPDAVFEGSGLWQGQWGQARAAGRGVGVEDLPEIYRQRSALKQNVTAADVAEAALFFASDRSAKITGAILTVDAGLADGYVR
ncbi:MAG TPA: bifunctional rhamnulose-1-phosphate aldolase/short-chain dehydrogenase [Chloroflexota bacterium]|nr:bifunctional rhamnulose-1-phosphate aldolase/short-chain dehydrogenase [Chloroflexota bacterium]